MCGRYSETHPIEKLQERFKAKSFPEDFRPRYNISPTQQVPVIVDHGERSIQLYRWGLIPSWAKDPSIGYKMINARGETVHEKPSFRRPFQKSRCLVASDGFYEWKKEGKSKTPYRITLKSREPFAFAGVWDTWTDPEGKEVKSFSIVTTSASDLLKPIHDRMPVILKPEDEEIWLDPDAKVDQLLKLIGPYPEAEMEAYSVSSIVNSARNETPDCIVPFSENIAPAPPSAKTYVLKPPTSPVN